MPGGDLAPRQQLPAAPRQEEERALSGKKNRGGQDPRRESEAREPVEEAKGSPGDPAYLEQTGEDPGTIEEEPLPQEEEPGGVAETETASERLVVELLPVLDNLDRALEAEGDIREGVRATRDQLADALGREGLLPVASDGLPFDPNVHEAVMGQPSEEHEEGTILQTFERGYLLNGKPIRPAKVVVAKQV